MITIKLEGGTEVKLYNSIKEMPICLAQKQSVFLIQEAEIGYTMEDLHNKIDRGSMFIANAKYEEALNELTNLKLCLFSIDKEINYKSLAFGCYIQSIDGNKLTDYSAESLRSVIDQLSKEGLTNEMVDQQLNDLKKNAKRN